MNRRSVLGGLLEGAAISAALQVASRAKAGDTGLVELEIIASSLQDAVAAYEGGASRLEVCIRLDRGGLTPPRRMIERIVREVPIPARAMLRVNAGFVLTGKDELEQLETQARVLAELGIEGLITGYVKAGELDLETLHRLVAAAPSMRFTVHNAIEMTASPLKALQALRAFRNVDRALITGGKGSLSERIERLPAYERAFGPDRRLVLGGLRLAGLPQLRRSTDISTFHLGVAVRTPQGPDGAVDIDKVKEARRLLQQIDI